MEKIKNENVRGIFYPNDKEEIIRIFNNFEKEIKEEIELFIANLREEKLKALILPHAAYQYSGLVATYGYLLAKKLKKDYNKIAIFGPSHYFYFLDFLQPNFDYYKTPLGKIKVIKTNLVDKNNDVFNHEHSIEVHLPFVKYFLKINSAYLFLAGEVLDIEFLLKFHNAEKPDLIIVSSDLSHYNQYNKARQIDLNTIKFIIKKDLKNFVKYGDACGKEIIKSLLYLSKIKNWNIKLIKYLNSGDITKDFSKVVGYATIAFFENN